MFGLVRIILSFVNFDIFPEFSTKLRKFINSVLGIILSLALLSMVCGLFIHNNAYIITIASLIILSMNFLISKVTCSLLEGEVICEESVVYEGNSLNLLIQLYNSSYWHVRGIQIHLQSYSNDQLYFLVTSIPKKSQLEFKVHIPHLNRGIYPNASPFVSSSFPFGIWKFKRELKVAKKLVIWPRVFPVGSPPHLDALESHNGFVLTNRAGSYGDVLAIRPYRYGDSVRKIHWAQTARHNELIICEMQALVYPRIHIILDVNVHIHAGAYYDSTREWAIRIVGSFVKGWIQQGLEVGAEWTGFFLQPACSASHMQKIMNALAGLPDNTNKPLLEILLSSSYRCTSHAVYIVVTTDKALTGICFNDSIRYKWVVLRCNGFDKSTPQFSLPSGFTPWLLIDSPQSVPLMLLNGWLEPRYGT